MATLHCDYTNGNDTTGNGSSGNPWKTLQKVVDNGTGGDTWKIANTSAQVLTAEISWATGWTADNNKYTIIEAWDNGGSITIQRPDEASARVGAELSLSGSVQAFSTSSIPEKIVLKGIKITGGDTVQLTTSSNWVLSGGQFTRPSTVDNYNLVLSGNNVRVYNTFFDNITGTRGLVAVSGNFASLKFNYFDNLTIGGAYGDPYAFVDISNSTLYTNISSNIFKVTTAGDIAVRFKDNFTGTIESNTFVSSGGASDIGILIYGINFFGTIYADQEVINNIFYNFDGSGSKPISFSGSPRLQRLGYNAFYDCNASDSATQVAIDDTANDVTGTGDPFVDSANDDYSVTGSTAEDAGLGNP